MTDPILDNLNPQQFQAVTAPDGPLLIVAGAGTGKTRVVTRRMAYLMRERGIRPWQIYAATFTNKAADEMKHRLIELVSNVNPSDFNISTFHSMCARILRREALAAGLNSNFTICDDKDQQSAIKHVMTRIGITDKVLKPSDAQFVINQCKMRMLGPADVSTVATSQEELYEEIFTDYEKYLQTSSAVDFEDLILKTVQLFQNNESVLRQYQDKFRYVMVDEYQDTNKVQVELVSMLAATHRNLTVVGDEDQSIYSWRGADINNLLDFQKHFPDAEIIRLEQNYRSTGNILKAADATITYNTERLGKVLFTDLGDGPPLYVSVGRSETEEAETVAFSIEAMRRRGYPYSDMAIFYRVSSLSRVFEDAMRRYNIPYRMIGGTKFYDRAEIKDLLSYMQVAANPDNTIALRRIINTPRRGIGDKTVELLAAHARRHDCSLFQSMRSVVRNQVEGISGKAATSIERLVAHILNWQEYALTVPPSDLLEKLLEDTGYVISLGDPNSLDVISRRENLDELLNSIISFEKNNRTANLTDYLENVSLVSVTDDLDATDDSISLMTLHAAKGLEYKVVFMVGLEESLFPNHRAASSKGDYEEERRLFYVGITRAREFLVLSRAAERMYYGEFRANDESRFIHELPQEIMRPLHPYNPEFHDTAEEAPTELGLGYPGMETQLFQRTRGSSAGGGYGGSYNNKPGGGYGTRRPAVDRTPFGRGPMSSGRSRSSDDFDSDTRHVAPASSARFGSGGGIQLGQRVRHKLLGEGVITAVSGSGGDRQYVIQLEDGIEHQLLARYAKLEVISDES